MSDVLGRVQTALADRYAIESEIGRGGMATVFLAEDRKHHRKVAVKVLHPELASTVGAERFLREVEIAAQLEHPHILTLIDSGDADGLLYYVMPFVEGESLRQRLDRETQLPLGDALRIAREVASALQYAHARGVVHRDIKPANILLSAGEAVVADFGIARAIEQAERQKITQTGMVVGTPSYMSPEQASGEAADERSDTYALGCILYEMLAGQPPLTGITPPATQARRLTETPPPIHHVRSSVPEAVDRVVAKALDPVPADRYASAAEFASVMEAATRAEALEARHPAVQQRSRRSVTRAAVIAGAVVVVAIAAWQLLPSVMAPGSEPGSATGLEMGGSIAVLPFENIGGSEEDAYFVDGVHNEILTHLHKIKGLRPISRTSVMQYRGTEKNLPRIAEELGADAIMEGSVQRAGGIVRINVQLIDAGTDEHLWAEIYDRELTAANILGIQSDIAQQIAAALHAELSPEVAARINARPTDNLEAYDLYLRSHRELNEGGTPQAAVELLNRAVELDPGFAAAHAVLAGAHTQLFYIGGRIGQEHCEKAREELELARELGPEVAAVYTASGWYYYQCYRDYDQALTELAHAERLAPNDVYVLEPTAAVLRRQGRMEEAIATFLRASELNPLYGDLHLHLATSYGLLRKSSEAILHIERAISLVPRRSINYGIAAELYLGQQRDLRRAREVLERAKSVGVQSNELIAREMWLDILEGRADAVLEKALLLPADEVIPRFLLRPPLRTRFQFLAEAHRLRGDRALGQAYLDSARILLEERVVESKAPFLRSALGLVYAGLGRRDDAVREGETAVELLSLEKDAWDGAFRLEDLARIYVAVGEHEAAIDLLEQLFSIPFDLTATHLVIDPTWDPLRTDPRFQALLGADS